MFVDDRTIVHPDPKVVVQWIKTFFEVSEKAGLKENRDKAKATAGDKG